MEAAQLRGKAGLPCLGLNCQSRCFVWAGSTCVAQVVTTEFINALTVVQRLASVPHSKKVLASIPGPDVAFLCGVFMFSLCLRRFPPGTPVSPTTKNMYNRPGTTGGN